jgi:6-phosphogluconolactonase (cycloisomerase 2 family)
VPNGTSYFVRVATQPGTPTQFCSAPNGAGIATANTAITVVCNAGTPKYLYTTDFAANVVYGVAVDGSTGGLSPTGAPTVTGVFPVEPAVAPSGAFFTSGAGGFLYVRNSTDGTVSAFSINSATGVLTAVPGSPFAVTGVSTTIVQTLISPTGRFIYFFDQGPGGAGPRRIFTYLIQANGALVAVAGSPLTVVDATHRLEIDPLGRWLYGATSQHIGTTSIGTVVTYRVDPGTGALSSAGTTPANGTVGLARGAAHPNGQWLYIARDTKNMPGPPSAPAVPAAAVDAYSVDQATGQLTLIGTVAAGSDQGTVPRIDPLGKFLYVPSVVTGVSGFAINQTTGALTAVPGSPVLVGVSVGQLDVEPTGKYLYSPVRTGAGTEGIAMHSINAATGQLSIILGSPFLLGANVNPTFVRADASGRWLFVASFGDDKLTSLDINPTTGVLSFRDSEPAGTNATHFAIAGTQ